MSDPANCPACGGEAMAAVWLKRDEWSPYALVRIYCPCDALPDAFARANYRRGQSENAVAQLRAARRAVGRWNRSVERYKKEP